MPVPPLGNDAPSVLATPPVIVNNMRTTPCVRAQVVAPRIAGTLKIWGASDQPPQPSAAPKLTLVLFPPPAGEDQAIRSRGS
jgi:hypothetical protein